MEYEETKTKKLSFKGDKKIKKKKSKHRSDNRDSRKKTDKRTADTGVPEKTWIPVNALADLEGPLTICFQDKKLYILSLPPAESTQTLADPKRIPPGFHPILDQPTDAVEPTSIEQVFVGRKSVPTSTYGSAEAEMFSFKSCHDTYLSADRQGHISCTSTAIGPLEMWTPVLLPERGEGAVAFMINPPGISEDRFLSVDTDNEEPASFPIHAKATTIGFCQVFTVRCQAAIQRKRKAENEKIERERFGETLTGDAEIDEVYQAKKYQSFQDGRLHISKRSRSELKDAQSTGRYNEELLNRRSKMKSDRYCK